MNYQLAKQDNDNEDEYQKGEDKRIVIEKENLQKIYIQSEMEKYDVAKELIYKIVP